MELPPYLHGTSSPAELLVELVDRMKPTRIVVITDDNTRRFCYPIVSQRLSSHTVVTVPPGEERKNLRTCEDIWRAMGDAHLDRHALVVNLGGGVVCDMGGFCAAVYKRGLRFIHCPTTLLGQVDASVGGKLGIDFECIKNQIGLFQDPDAALISTVFLETLPLVELRCGHAEMVKHALISSAQDWRNQVAMSTSSVPSETQILHSVTLKQRVVAQDPTEQHLRKALNLGHTIGHAVEAVLLERPRTAIRHGEAVALGLVAEAWLSQRCLGLAAAEVEMISAYVGQEYPAVNLAGISKSGFFSALGQDKKNVGDSVRASLLREIGDCVVDVEVPRELCWEALQYYGSLHG